MERPMTKTLEELRGEGEKEFDESFVERHFYSEPPLYDTAFDDINAIKKFIQQEREKVFKAGQLSGVELAKDKDERLESALEALEMMYQQYCGDGHLFMSAGEAASSVLERENRMSFDEIGRITNLNNLQGELGK